MKTNESHWYLTAWRHLVAGMALSASSHRPLVPAELAAVDVLFAVRPLRKTSAEPAVAARPRCCDQALAPCCA